MMDYKKYLRSLKPFIIFAFSFFIISVLEGYFFAKNYPEKAREIISRFSEMFSPVFDVSSFSLAVIIFVNNSFSLLLSIILGFFFGLVPLLSLFSNGMLLGVFAVIWQERLSLDSFFVGVLPHGLIEIPVLVIGAAIGLKIGFIFLSRLIKKEGEVKKEILSGFIFFGKFLIPLLLLAAFIEAFITPLLL